MDGTAFEEALNEAKHAFCEWKEAWKMEYFVAGLALVLVVGGIAIALEYCAEWHSKNVRGGDLNEPIGTFSCRCSLCNGNSDTLQKKEVKQHRSRA